MIESDIIAYTVQLYVHVEHGCLWQAITTRFFSSVSVCVCAWVFQCVCVFSLFCEIHLATFAFIYVLNFKADIVSERDCTSEDVTQ